MVVRRHLRMAAVQTVPMTRMRRVWQSLRPTLRLLQSARLRGPLARLCACACICAAVLLPLAMHMHKLELATRLQPFGLHINLRDADAESDPRAKAEPLAWPEAVDGEGKGRSVSGRGFGLPSFRRRSASDSDGPSPASVSAPLEVSVATFNLWNTMFSWQVRKHMIADMIRQRRPDVVALQEVREYAFSSPLHRWCLRMRMHTRRHADGTGAPSPRSSAAAATVSGVASLEQFVGVLSARTSALGLRQGICSDMPSAGEAPDAPASQLRELQELLSPLYPHAAFVPAGQEWATAMGGAVRFREGVALLSAHPLERTAIFRFAALPSDGDTNQRVALYALVSPIGAAPLNVFVSHLSYDRLMQCRQVAELRTFILQQRVARYGSHNCTYACACCARKQLAPTLHLILYLRQLLHLQCHYCLALVLCAVSESDRTLLFSVRLVVFVIVVPWLPDDYYSLCDLVYVRLCVCVCMYLCALLV